MVCGLTEPLFLFPNESQGKGCLLPDAQILVQAGCEPSVSPHIKKNRSLPPATGRCVSTAIGVIAYSVPGTVLKTWISSILFYEGKHNYHPILQMVQ